MKRIECIGRLEVGNIPSSEMQFWDTGKTITQEELAEFVGLQRFIFSNTGKVRRDAINRLAAIAIKMTHEHNVWPVDKGALTDNGHIVVNSPYFEEKEGGD